MYAKVKSQTFFSRAIRILHMNTSKYFKLAKFFTDEGLWDIQELKLKAIFIQNPDGRRSTSYRLTT
jgi:hypothetical protein